MGFYAPTLTPFVQTLAASHAGMLVLHGLCFCDEDRAVFTDCFSFWVEEIDERDDAVLEMLRGLSAGWSGTFDDLLDAARTLWR
jgi:hypothetical protein